MTKDRYFLIGMYNATSTDDGKGSIETYEGWLEKQLLKRIERIEELEALDLAADTIQNIQSQLNEAVELLKKVYDSEFTYEELSDFLTKQQKS